MEHYECQHTHVERTDLEPFMTKTQSFNNMFICLGLTIDLHSFIDIRA